MSLQVTLRKTFNSGQVPFSLEVDFEAPVGITMLFGPSGAGKSSTLDCIAGISRPDEGRIQVGERCLFVREVGKRPVTDVSLRQRKVGYVFQQLGLFEHLSVLDNVLYGLNTLPHTEARETAVAMLEQLRIGHTADRRPRLLSGGERQRVALARTLVVYPDILLLDEPLSALDTPTKRVLMEDLDRLRHTLNIPILYVSHNTEEVFALGDQVLIYEAGRIKAKGTPDEVLT
ncbi:MAG: ATP-binding cassette domain-containing protein [Blastocatellia bacterium]|nr:ATP-binding cassette domain-containing protein [Blastocatellia bacterium]